MSPPPTVRVARVAPEVVRPLRQRVLRPHQTVAEQVYDGDDAPGAAHFAAYADDRPEPIGVASIVPEPFPGAGGARPGDWRVRGMATDPDGGRSIGAGALLLRACLHHARATGAARVWCNARAGVRGFYEREGFTAEGDQFTLPDIGPHFLMWLPV